MVDSPEDIAAKAAANSDLGLLKSILSITSDKSSNLHSACPLCASADALQYGPDKKYLGQHFWHCHSCGKGGDALEAMKQVERRSFPDVMKIIRQKYGNGKALPYSPRNEIALRPSAEMVRIDQSRDEPILDIPRAEAFVKKHHEYLMAHLDYSEKYGRGISREVIEKYRIGFIENEEIKFSPWAKRGLNIPAGWVLPITDGEGVLKAVKLHFESLPDFGPNKKCPKNLWCPFGTTPAYDQLTDTKPIHSYYGMWPHPLTLTQVLASDFSMEAAWWIQRIPDELQGKWLEQVEMQRWMVADEKNVTYENMRPDSIWEAQLRAFAEMKKEVMSAVRVSDEIQAQDSNSDTDWSNYTFIPAGELKALAWESAGMMATAPTGGESWMPGPSLFSYFSGKPVCLLYDDDPPKLNEKTNEVICAGLKWARRWSEALIRYGSVHVVAKSGGRKEK